MHDPATCRDGDHYGQCSGATLVNQPRARVGHRRPDHADCECVEEIDHGSFDCDCPGYLFPQGAAYSQNRQGEQ